jgi:hypothetical protein
MRKIFKCALVGLSLSAASLGTANAQWAIPSGPQWGISPNPNRGYESDRNYESGPIALYQKPLAESQTLSSVRTPETFRGTRTPR